jgi:molecular chaperone IbpA
MEDVVMVAQRYDFGPLFGSTVGFDRVFDLLESATRGEQRDEKYPPYDIERTGENAYRITLAVAGFKENELTITAERNLLLIEGEHRRAEETGTDRQFLHRGIGARAFKQRFQLADHVKVTDANLTDGLLTIKLVREIPEVLRPRRIEVGRKSAESKPEQIEGQRAA